MISHLKNAFFLSLTIMGLSFLALALLIGSLAATGRVTGGQLRNMIRVLGGYQYYVADSREYREYRQFAADREAFLAAAAQEHGDPAVRAHARQEAEGLRRQLEESRTTALREMDLARRDILQARAEKERLQRELDAQRRLFLDRVAKEAAVRVAAEIRKFGAMLAGMDEAALAGDLSAMDVSEAARYVREYLPADFAAEVLGAMRPDLRRSVLPLVENPNAGLDPRDAARHMAQRLGIEGTYAMGPAEIYGQLSRMNAPQALATFMNLPSDLQGELEPLLRAGRP